MRERGYGGILEFCYGERIVTSLEELGSVAVGLLPTIFSIWLSITLTFSHLLCYFPLLCVWSLTNGLFEVLVLFFFFFTMHKDFVCTI